MLRSSLLRRFMVSWSTVRSLGVVAAIALAIGGGRTAQAIDLTRPAHLQIRVQDVDGHAVPDANIRLVRTIPDWPVVPPSVMNVTTDAEGQAVVECRHTDGDPEIAWAETILIQAKGYIAKEAWTTLFPGAKVEKAISIEPERVTLIRLRGPKGEPLPGVEFSVYYSDGEYARTLPQNRSFPSPITDAHGEYRWVHGKLEDGFRLSLTGEEKYQDESVVSIALTKSVLPAPERPFQGKVLLADGKPAVGWFVAPKTKSRPGGSLPGPDEENIVLKDLVRIGDDGEFQVIGGTVLAIVSPEGMPFLYWVSPQTWQPGPRCVTLRLPALRRQHRGRVVDVQGRPVSGLPIRLYALHSTWGELCRISGPPPCREFCLGLDDGTATTGKQLGGIRTDEQGTYTLPIYFGSLPRWLYWPRGSRLEGEKGPGADTQSVLMQDQEATADQLKEVTLVFEDEQGRPIPDLPLCVFAPKDSRGVHLFVKKSADRMEIKTRPQDKTWFETAMTIDLTGTEDQTIRVPIGKDRRMKPLAGKVIDPDGRAVTNARIHLLNAKDTLETIRRSGTGGYLGYRTRTDAQGCFSFDAAPDVCAIEAARWPDNPEGPLPGWVDPVVVDSETRKVDIQLRRGGALRILLPEGLNKDTSGIYAALEDQPEALTRTNCALVYQADGNYLHADAARPGWYHLVSYERTREALGDLSRFRVQIKTGAVAVVDLRGLKITAPPLPVKREKAWTAVTVMHEGQPVSGAEVAVYADAEHPEDVARWIKQLKDNDPEIWKAAASGLTQAGLQAIAAMEASDAAILSHQRLNELKEKRVSDGLRRLIMDLSDDAGGVRCEAELGRRCIAVALLRGRLVGYREFAAGDREAAIEMRPVRTLVLRISDDFHLPRKEDPSQNNQESNGEPDFDETTRSAPAPDVADDPSQLENRRLWELSVRPVKPLTKGSRAMMRVISREKGWYGSDLGHAMRKEGLPQNWLMKEDEASTWVLEDLPVGDRFVVELRNAFSDDSELTASYHVTVTIEEGAGVQEIAW